MLRIGARAFPPRPWAGIRELFAAEEPTPPSAEEVSVTPDASAEVQAVSAEEVSALPAVDVSASSYDAALLRIVAALDVPRTAKELTERTGMKPPQLTQWLKRAVEEKAIVKLAKPARYGLPQRRLFDMGKQA